MQNSPDPEEEEEILEEDDGGETSSQADSVLLQEMQALSQTLNNNWSYDGEDTGKGFSASRFKRWASELVQCFSVVVHVTGSCLELAPLC